MHFSGHIERGAVVLDEALDLPDGTLVTIATVESASSRELHPDIQRLAGLIPAGVDLECLRLESLLEKHS